MKYLKRFENDSWELEDDEPNPLGQEMESEIEEILTLASDEGCYISRSKNHWGRLDGKIYIDYNDKLSITDFIALCKQIYERISAIVDIRKEKLCNVSDDNALGQRDGSIFNQDGSYKPIYFYMEIPFLREL